jgi:hypothetical protein
MVRTIGLFDMVQVRITREHGCALRRALPESLMAEGIMLICSHAPPISAEDQARQATTLALSSETGC